MKDIPTKKLNDRAKIPVLGFGTWPLKGRSLQKALDWAFEAGYRHIDTADFYNNHKDIGEYIDLAGIKRDDLFITTKVWKTDLEPENVKKVLENALKDLRTDYIDLYLIHAPNYQIPVVDTLGAMRELQEEGLVNAIGVSNFNVDDLRQVKDIQNDWRTDFQIVNNQIEFNLSEQKNDITNYCLDNNITVTAYSPLGKGLNLDHELIVELSDKYDRANSQIILRWLIQKGFIVIPSSSKRDHIRENADIFNFELEDEDITKLNNIE
jgi:diketogulonate reductase-like aldo/keto reductase